MPDPAGLGNEGAMSDLTIEQFIHAHYVSGRGGGIALGVVGALGVVLGLVFASEVHDAGERQVGFLFAGISLAVAFGGAAWWRMRRDPTRTPLHAQLVGERDRVVWVYRGGFHTGGDVYMFARDDGRMIGVALKRPGPGSFSADELAKCFARAFPKAMHGETKQNNERYFALLEERGVELHT